MRRRSRSRGAALAEVTVLAPILILMWIGIDYFRAGYARRLQALSQAERRAWKQSFARDGSCFAGASANVSGLEKLVIGPDATILDDAIDRYAATRPAWAFKLAHVETQVSLDGREARWGGGQRGTVTGGAFLPCNEMISDDRDVQPAVGPLFLERFK